MARAGRLVAVATATILLGIGSVTGSALTGSALTGSALAGSAIAAEPAGPVTRTGTLVDLARQIPAVPPLTAGYAFKSFRTPGARYSRAASGRIVTMNGRRMAVTPVLGLPHVWAQGGYGWPGRMRRTYGRTMPTFTAPARSSFVPRSLMSALAEGYPALTCPQVAALVTTLTAWGLSIDPALKPNLVAAAEACPARTLAITLKNATRRIQPLSSRNRYSSSGDSTVTSVDQVVATAPGPLITSELFGLHVPHSTGPAQVPYGYLRLWDADVGWNAVEPRRGTFHWTVLDRAVRSAEELGAKVSYVFGPTPGWAGDLSTDPPRDLEDFRGFADALIDRYGDRIAAFEVWNEPNLKTSYTGTVSEMVQMTQILRESADAAGVDSLVLSPSTTTRTGGSFYNFYLSYVRALGKVGWPIDGYAFHSYPRASGTPADRVHGIALFRAMLDVARAPDLPLFESEINYGLAGLDEPQRPITGTQAQGYLAQTFIEGVRYGITSVQWYLWSSRPYPLLGVQLDPTATHTKLAWDWTIAQLVGASLRGCLDSAGAAICGFERDGATFALAYSPTGVPTDVPVPPGLDEVCSMDGVCQPVTTPTVTVGLRPLRLQPTP